MNDLTGTTIGLKVKKLHPDAVIPTYGTGGAACFDLYALEGGVVKAGCSQAFRVGLAFEIPEDWVMTVYSRSGHGFKGGVRLANCVGVIDSDYRGELAVKLQSDDAPLVVKAGDRIAQAMLEQVVRVRFQEVDQLGETNRGAGGFGSTGQ